jgi:hypothetical protein
MASLYAEIVVQNRIRKAPLFLKYTHLHLYSDETSTMYFDPSYRMTVAQFAE